jgi:hypothetical protein
MNTWTDVLFYSAIGSASMIGKDMVGTILMDAIANGKAKLAGACDFALDWLSIIVSAFSGVRLLDMGAKGWIGVIPIAIAGGATTYHTVKWSHKNIKPEEEA